VRVAQANAARVLDSVQKLILVDPSWGRDVSLAHIENEHGDDGDFVLGGDFAKLDFRPLEKDLCMPALILAGRFDRILIPSFPGSVQDLCAVSTIR